jgi:membrane protease subunit HflC
VIQVVREMREQLMAHVRDQLDREAKQFGIEVVDVRIRRADLPEQNSQAVYKRMQTEREREAQEFRSQGTQKAQEIRARADRDATVTVAEATSKKAEQTRGEGNAGRNRIFADAFSRDRTSSPSSLMQAWGAGWPGAHAILVRPDWILPLLPRRTASSAPT